MSAEDTWAKTGIQAEVPVESDAYARAAQRRFTTTLQYVDTLQAPVLDLGPPNALARVLEKRHGVRIEHTGERDLDRTRLADFAPGPYATITAFEILEHLMNPLFVLDGCREVLRPDGVLHLSVPRRHPHEWLFGKSPEHFHEFAPDELRWALEKAGFEIEQFTLANTSEMSLGVRPLLRRLFRNLLIVRCRPRGANVAGARR
jgi:SAM-dependent methyltransferase